jgi:hypothetical protein
MWEPWEWLSSQEMIDFAMMQFKGGAFATLLNRAIASEGTNCHSIRADAVGRGLSGDDQRHDGLRIDREFGLSARREMARPPPQLCLSGDISILV